MRLRWISILLASFFWISPAIAKTPRNCITRAQNQLMKTYEQIRAIMTTMDYRAGGIPCQAQKSEMTRAEWDTLKPFLWNNKNYRNTNPNGECNARATLISLELDRLGYKSEKIFIKAPKLAAVQKKQNGYVVYPYRRHTANVVTIRDEMGQARKFVLDPMFTDDLVPIQKYVEDLTCADDPPPEYDLVRQDSEPAWEYLTENDTEVGCAYPRLVVKGSEDLVKINKRVESRVGGHRVYSVDFDETLPIRGPDPESAKKAFCKEYSGVSEHM